MNATDPTPQRLFKAAEVGELLGGIKATTVMEWQRQHGWDHVRIGRSFRWTAEQVQAIIRQHTVTAGKIAPADGRTTRSASRRRS